LLELYQKAKDANLMCSLIKDAGLTEFKEPTFTAIAIGPDESEKIDVLTKNLPLY
jgi:peptidyl-tRNA hydrolase, PTH2 family